MKGSLLEERKSERTFLTMWTLAVLAATTAFVLHLGLRVKSVELGYELGREHARVARLREVKHVLGSDEVKTYMATAGIEVVGSTPMEFGVFFRAEKDLWAKVIRETGAKID